MSRASIANSRRPSWVTRRVRAGRVVIDGRTYRPAPSDVPYVGQLDGHRCMFRRRASPPGSTSPVVTLWGVWDPDEWEYLDDRGPQCVGGQFPFEIWSATEEDLT